MYSNKIFPFFVICFLIEIRLLVGFVKNINPYWHITLENFIEKKIFSPSISIKLTLELSILALAIDNAFLEISIPARIPIFPINCDIFFDRAPVPHAMSNT